MRNKLSPSKTQRSPIDEKDLGELISESGCGSDNEIDNESEPENEAETEIEIDIEDEFESELDDPSPSIHVLGLLKRRTIQFIQFCDVQQKWEKSSGKIDLTHGIESFRDAIMIPVDKSVVIFHMQNGSISHAQSLTLESAALENITLPHDIECANLALFCHMNDKIYCFARSDQQYFFG